MTRDLLPQVPNAGPGRYRVGRHGGGDCVYLQLSEQPSKQDPRICVTFPRLTADGNAVLLSAPDVAAEIVDALNAQVDAAIAADPHA
jgi:hypothetical protein